MGIDGLHIRPRYYSLLGSLFDIPLHHKKACLQKVVIIQNLKNLEEPSKHENGSTHVNTNVVQYGCHAAPRRWTRNIQNMSGHIPTLAFRWTSLQFCSPQAMSTSGPTCPVSDQPHPHAAAICCQGTCQPAPQRSCRTSAGQASPESASHHCIQTEA